MLVHDGGESAEHVRPERRRIAAQARHRIGAPLSGRTDIADELVVCIGDSDDVWSDRSSCTGTASAATCALGEQSAVADDQGRRFVQGRDCAQLGNRVVVQAMQASSELEPMPLLIGKSEPFSDASGKAADPVSVAAIFRSVQV